MHFFFFQPCCFFPDSLSSAHLFGCFNIDLNAYSRKGDAISFTKLTIYIISVAYLYIQVIAMIICMAPVNLKNINIHQ